MTSSFTKTNKDFGKYDTYEDKLLFLKEKNKRIFDDIVNNEHGINIEEIEDKMRDGVNVGHGGNTIVFK